MEDSNFCGNCKIEMDKADIVWARLEDLGFLRDGCRGSIVEPVQKQVRVFDHDQRLDDHSLEKFFHKSFLDLKKIIDDNIIFFVM